MLDRYVGKPFKFAIMNLGLPDNVYSDSDTGRILAYTKTTTQYRPGISIDNSTIDFTLEPYGWDSIEGSFTSSGYQISEPPSSIEKEKYIYLYVDQSGTIYHYLHNIKSTHQKKAEVSSQNNTIYLILDLTTAVGLAGLLMSQE